MTVWAGERLRRKGTIRTYQIIHTTGTRKLWSLSATCPQTYTRHTSRSLQKTMHITIRRSCGRNTSTARRRTAQRVHVLPVSVCTAACNNVLSEMFKIATCDSSENRYTRCPTCSIVLSARLSITDGSNSVRRW